MQDKIQAISGLQRIAMVVEYDGALFHGWQRQPSVQTVQQTVEEALARIEGRDVTIHAAGRTDTGVHALAMLVHCDVTKTRWQRSHRAYTQGMNQLLPEAVRIIAVATVTNDFHARFDCLERRYRYQIWRRDTPSALLRWQHWWIPRPLDIEAMQQAAECLLGKQNFRTFQAAGCQAKSSVKHMRVAKVYANDHELFIELHADAFLYHMVRNIVGSLVQVGFAKWSPDDFVAVLHSGDRSRAASMAPPQGLYFMDAVYNGFTSQQLITSANND